MLSIVLSSFSHKQKEQKETKANMANCEAYQNKELKKIRKHNEGQGETEKVNVCVGIQMQQKDLRSTHFFEKKAKYGYLAASIYSVVCTCQNAEAVKMNACENDSGLKSFYSSCTFR